ncbi:MULTISPECIES: hypothetical protein [unclassified Myxococcus]|uniref:hypothetical protein n=1 Tax=unclassified Myxococcus TaxID=2648731 RepID=UPI0020C6332D|nr:MULTISPECIES: hypothetical protein [unclassified Myxococcus]
MFLHALGHFHPPNLLTNTFLGELGLATMDAWILERVGIRSRHTMLPLDYLRMTVRRVDGVRSMTRPDSASSSRPSSLS